MNKSLTSILSFILFAWTGSSIAQDPTIGLIQNSPGVYEGLTLFTPNQQTYLINNCGQIIHSWTSSSQPGLTAYLRDNGNLLRAGSAMSDLSGPGGGGLIEEYDWDGNLLWSYTMADSMGIQHHDIEPMPNGNVLAIAWEIKTPTEAEAAGVSSSNASGVWPLVIYELQPDGAGSAAIVWEWHAWDHLIQDQNDTKANFGVVEDHPELLDVNYNLPSFGGDWLHANSIDYNQSRDEILLSIRHLHEIYIIDHSTTTEEAAGHSGGDRGKGGDILYRWGNALAYRGGMESDQQLFRQHDAQWIPSGYVDEGKISIFNNGAGRTGGDFSSIDIIDPPIDGTGGYVFDNNVYGPEQVEWTYFKTDDPSDFFIQNMGGAHRLPNGNTLITESISGRIFEVNTQGEVVWEYINPTDRDGPLSQGSTTNIAVFRATKYPIDFPAFIGRNLIPRDRIELDALPLNCNFTSTQILPSSEVGLVSTVVDQYLNIENRNSRKLSIQVFNSLGRTVGNRLTVDAMVSIDAGHWNSGMYFVRITDMNTNQFRSSKLIKIN